MKCDACDNEATVHEVTVRDGVKVERHLCESCANLAGLAPSSPASPLELLKMVIEPGPQKPPKQVECPTCGLTFEDFRTGGLLGCAQCYDTFESKLMPLIERAHEGGIQHIGKTPSRLCGQAQSSKARVLAVLIEERAHRAAAIRRLLDEAIKSEHYERAAQLRDELRRLSEEPSPPPQS